MRSESSLLATKPDDQPIEAGEVGEIKDLPFHEAKHLAETARTLSMPKCTGPGFAKGTSRWAHLGPIPRNERKISMSHGSSPPW